MSAGLEMAAVTHPGRVRSHNEDCLAAHAHAGVAVLADGMGGHHGGEVASRLAVETVSSALVPDCANVRHADGEAAEKRLRAEMARANRAVFAAARADVRYSGMGTTLVIALWHAAGVTYAHVGDSRLYRLRAGELRRLTRDHSLVQKQVDSGEINASEARHAPHRNVLTRAVGVDPDVEPDVGSERVFADDVYLLCSDGLTEMLSDDEIRRVLLASRGPLELTAQRLVDRANEQGGLDNISVILARGAPISSARP